MTENTQKSEFRTAIEECHAAANDILEIQNEIETKTKLWKSMGWNYFMKPVPGTTEEEAASEKADLYKTLKMWVGIPAICLVVGILLMMVDLGFTRGLGGLLLVVGFVGLYANILILPMKFNKMGALGRLNEQTAMIYKGSWQTAKSRVDDLVKTQYDEAKQYLTEYSNLASLDRLLRGLTPVLNISQFFQGQQANRGQGGKDAAIQNVRMIISQDSFDNEQKIICSKCGSDKLEFDEKTEVTGGFNKQNACLGFICFGPLGLLCGNHNAKPKQINTTHWRCSNCKNKF